MTGPRPAALAMGAIVLLMVVELLRRRQLREKYAAIWLVVSLVALTVGLFPPVLFGAARILGFEVPANLIFFAGSLVLTAISMQLSLEVGRLEEHVRTLAEELALLRHDVEQLGRTGRDGTARSD